MIDFVTKGKLKMFNFSSGSKSEPIQHRTLKRTVMNISTDTVKEPIFIQIGGGKDFIVLI